MNIFWDIQDHYNEKLIDFSYWHKVDDLNDYKSNNSVIVFANYLHQVRFVCTSYDEIEFNQKFFNDFGLRIFKILYAKDIKDVNELKDEMIKKYNLQIKNQSLLV